MIDNIKIYRTGDNSNPNTLERETDLQHEMEAGQGARAAQMTPRRVKRRNRSRSACVNTTLCQKNVIAFLI